MYSRDRLLTYDDMKKKSQGVYRKLQELDDQEIFEGDQLLPGRVGGRGGRVGRGRKGDSYSLKSTSQMLRRLMPKLYNDIIDDVVQEYGDEDDIPEANPPF